MNVDFGLGLLHGPLVAPHSSWLADLDAALPALRPHFRSLWMTDHFFWDGAPTFEAWTTLSYLAGRFPEYEVGPMVLGQNYRNPAMLALMASTLQTLSGGRALMGIGAGWKEDEYRAYGFEFPPVGQRMAQLEDTLVILRHLWGKGRAAKLRGRALFAGGCLVRTAAGAGDSHHGRRWRAANNAPGRAICRLVELAGCGSAALHRALGHPSRALR